MATQVSLSDIENVSKNDLSDKRLDTLQNGFNTFDEVLNGAISDSIALDKKAGKPYKIIDGRHRVYLARQKGYSSVLAKFV